MTNETEILDSIIRDRRSINSFKPDDVPVEIIQGAIDTAIWAPNHRMTEPWRFYLLGKETSHQVCKLNADLVSASRGEQVGQKKLNKWLKIPGWLVVSCLNSSDLLQQQEDYAACACVIQNLSLMLWAQGVGMKWTTGEVTRDDRFYETTWIDRQAETVVGLIWYGYPDEQPVSSRRAASELTVMLD